MIQTIDFLSASRFEALQGDAGLAVVSITDPDSSDARIPAGFGPVLHLKFDDLDEFSLSGGSVGQVFSPADAHEVTSFLDRIHRDQNNRGLIVHCEMGRSRSAAVAWYALAYGGRFVNERRIDGINLLVLGLLEKVGNRRLPRPAGMLVPAGFRLNPTTAKTPSL